VSFLFCVLSVQVWSCCDCTALSTM
jgi:hypothetical protein